MKTLIAAAALALTATVAHADIDYQKVFKAQGKTAAEIINGFDMALGRAGQQVSGNRLTADSTSLCLINKLLGVNLTAYGQIVIEAKNNQYRVTIQNTKLEFRDPRGVDLQVHRPGNTTGWIGNVKTWEACQVGFDKYIATLDQKMKQYQSW